MWKNFNESANDHVGYATYLRIFKNENIGFSRPSVDECEICLWHNDHLNEKDNDAGSNKTHEEYAASRIEYQKPLNADVTSYIFKTC